MAQACYERPMFVGLLVACLALALSSSACTAPEAPTSPVPSLPQPSIITDLESGLAFSIPADWVEESGDHQRVFSGPQGSPQYFTTITLQTLSSEWHESPTVALEKILESTEDSRARLIATESRLFPGSESLHPALWYSLELRHHRERFRRIGVIIAVSQRLVEIQYTASTPLFESSFLVFDSLLASLIVEP